MSCCVINNDTHGQMCSISTERVCGRVVNRLGVGLSPSRDLDFSMAHGSEQCEVKAGVLKSNTSGFECHY